MKERWFLLPVCYISGVLIGLCLLFPVIGPAVFFLAAPAFAVLQKQEKHRIVFSAAFALGLCMAAYLPAFSIWPSIDENWIFWIDLAVYIAICLIHGAVLAAALWLGYQLPAPRGFRWMYAALLWAGAEWLLGFGPLAWPTARLSLALWRYPVFLQSAAWGGQLLVSCLIVAVNALLAQAMCHRKQKTALLPLILALVLFGGNVFCGALLPEAPEADVPVAVVQPGGSAVGQNRGTVSLDALVLTMEAAQKQTKLILLPESILTADFGETEWLQRPWLETAMQAQADILVGGTEADRAVVYRIGSDGTLHDRYQKIREVPIFENGRGNKPLRLLPENHTSVLTTGIGKAGMLICYESMFSGMARKAAREGAQLLVVATNDSWFDSAMAKDLHLAHGVYRAVETGRTLIQASLNGNTAVIDRKGNRTAHLAADDSAVLHTKITLQTTDTLYNHMGDWWLRIGIIAAFAAAGYMHNMKRKRCL